MGGLRGQSQVSSVPIRLLRAVLTNQSPHILRNYYLIMRMRKTRRRRPALPGNSAPLPRRPRLPAPFTGPTTLGCALAGAPEV